MDTRTPVLLAVLLLASLATAAPQPDRKAPLDQAEELLADYEARAAEALCRRILAEDPADYAAWSLIARALTVVGDNPAAQKAWDEAERLAPDRPDAAAGRGWIAQQLDRRGEARQCFARALELDGRHAPSWAGLARLELEEGRFDEAERLLERAEAVAPDLAEVRTTRADLLYRRGDVTAATHIYRRVLAENPRHLGSLQRIANGFLETDRRPYQSPATSKQYSAQVKRARDLYHRSEFSSADWAFRSLEGGSAEDGRPSFYRGLIELRLGRPWEAIPYLRRALEREPDHHLYLNALAVAYRRKISLQRPEYGGAGGPDRLGRLQAYLSRDLVPRLAEVVRGLERLRPAERAAVHRAARPLARHLPTLAERRVTHDLLDLDESVTDAMERRYLRDRRTADGRWYGGVRGVGGRCAATGIESVLAAAELRYDTFAHELAHQVHRYALTASEQQEVRRLYLRAVETGHCLDYYAGTNEFEYFAQGYEAFVSLVKSPYQHSQRGHTRADLLAMDPELYWLLLGITGTPDPDPALEGLAGPALAFYEWTGDEVALKRIRALLQPFLDPTVPVR